MKTARGDIAHRSGLVFQPMTDFLLSEATEAAHYWASKGIDPSYLRDVHWADHVANLVARSGAASVLEFGSHWGRNLRAIQQVLPDAILAGVDINPDAVTYGIQQGYNVRVGDEHSLGSVESSSYDTTLTVSVLDHLPNPRLALSELIRIARKQVIMLEPWLGFEGKILRGPNPTLATMEDIDSYVYSWDYVRMIGEVNPALAVSHYPYTLEDRHMRQWLSASYHVFMVHIDQSENKCA